MNSITKSFNVVKFIIMYCIMYCIICYDIVIFVINNIS